MDKFERKLDKIGEKVNLDWERMGSQLKIYNFEVPEEKRGNGIGSNVMNYIIKACKNNDNIESILIHIDLTHRDEDGYYGDNVWNDPTVLFLKKFNFSVDASKNKTVLGKKYLN
jgi:GNAT superfamily N-acetyltransferase